MTPAPWYWADNVPDAPPHYRMIVDADGFIIAESASMSEADARLIAAAPDLLKALKALVSTARTFRNVPKDEQEWTSIDDDALEAAFDAIAKATREQA